MATESMEIPIFTGDDLRQWIDWLIDFFEREQFTDDDDKLNFTQSFMEGEARAWFLRRIRIFETWDELKRSLLIRFGRYDDPERINILLEEDQRWKALKNQIGKEIGEPSNSQPQESLVKKTEFPAFDGFMPYGWICRVERVFRASQYNEADKLALVSASLEGAARDWYSEEVIKGEFITWFSFKKRLLARFAPEENGSHSDVCTHVPEIVQDPVLKSAKNVESTNNEALQAASETCSNTLPAPYYGLVLEALPYEIGSDGLCVQDGEEPYILQVQTEDESTPPSLDFESIRYVSKLVNKRFLRYQTRETRKQRLFPKSWRFKYKKRMQLSINSEILGLALVNEMRVGWLQKRKKLLLLKYNLRMDDILGEKINGMGSVANDVSGSDALVRITGNGENENADVSLIQTENEPTTLKLFCVHQNSIWVTSKKKTKRYPKTWHFKYKDEEINFQNVEMTKGMVSATYEIFDPLSSIVGDDGAVVDNRRYVSPRKHDVGTLQDIIFVVVGEAAQWLKNSVLALLPVKSLQLQTIIGVAFQDYVAGIKNSNVEQETLWQGRDAFRVQLDLSRELEQALRVLPQILKGGLQFVHGAEIFQVQHKWNYKPFPNVSELELRKDGVSLQREAFVVLGGVIYSWQKYLVNWETILLSLMDQFGATAGSFCAVLYIMKNASKEVEFTENSLIQVGLTDMEAGEESKEFPHDLVPSVLAQSMNRDKHFLIGDETFTVKHRWRSKTFRLWRKSMRETQHGGRKYIIPHHVQRPRELTNVVAGFFERGGTVGRRKTMCF